MCKNHMNQFSVAIPRQKMRITENRVLQKQIISKMVVFRTFFQLKGVLPMTLPNNLGPLDSRKIEKAQHFHRTERT